MKKRMAIRVMMITRKKERSSDILKFLLFFLLVEALPFG